MSASAERTTSFDGLSIVYDHTVLVPRAWTQAQSRWARHLLDVVPEGPVLELCAGVGHLGLAAVRGSGRRAVLVDRDARAVELARRNAAGVEERVEVRHGSMSDVVAADERFALVVADPPWVPTHAVQRHPDDPRWAIDGGDDGLDVARLCLEIMGGRLMDGGQAVLQVGTAAQVAQLDPVVRAVGLHVEQVQEFERGALARLRRADA